MPLLPLVLSHGKRQKEAVGLLDTGAAVNVLPFSLGEHLGFIWDEEKTPLTLSGNLARLPARAFSFLRPWGLLPRFGWCVPGRKQTMCRSFWGKRTSSWSLRSASSGRERSSS
jgi:hypothetical protein